MSAFQTGVSIIAGTGGILRQALAPIILKHMREEAPVLAEQLKELIVSKTPVDTGTLQSAISYLVWPNVNDDMDLIWLYAEDLLQVAMWHRIYVQYQEGGLLGAPTYTNAPHEMFLSTAETDAPPLAATWGLNAVQNACDEWAIFVP